jgi:GT2 family glycosyltransferase
VRAVLERVAREDSRVRVTFRTENGHISRASNSALELVRGEFVVLLDHDDELSWDALAEVALALAAHPETDALYSDEDKIDDQGRRYDPYFKPDFLPDLLAGQNCLSHLSVFRAKLVREVGGFRAGYEGSQDWDLALRVIDASSPARVKHIPKVLYHWRAITGSTAIEVSEKSYSLDAARRALLDHFARRGLEVEVKPVPGAHWQIVYPLPDPRPLVSIIIPTRNAAKLVRACVESVFARTSYAPYEIVIVNNRSDEPDALALFRELAARPAGDVRVIDYDAPFNFSAIVNLGVRHARGAIVVLLNNDIETLDDRWLAELVSHAVRPEIGAVGAMLYYPDQTIQHAGIVLGLGGVGNVAFGHQPKGTDGYKNRARLVQNYSAVTAACLAIRRATYEQVGGFNESDLAVAFNDVDFCLRVRQAGFRNLWTPFAELLHHESVSRGREDTPEKQARFDREVAYMRATWARQLDHDPAYNLNLALSMEGWDLAWPPRT